MRFSAYPPCPQCETPGTNLRGTRRDIGGTPAPNLTPDAGAGAGGGILISRERPWRRPDRREPRQAPDGAPGTAWKVPPAQRSPGPIRTTRRGPGGGETGRMDRPQGPAGLTGQGAGSGAGRERDGGAREAATVVENQSPDATSGYRQVSTGCPPRLHKDTEKCSQGTGSGRLLHNDFGRTVNMPRGNAARARRPRSAGNHQSELRKARRAGRSRITGPAGDLRNPVPARIDRTARATRPMDDPGPPGRGSLTGPG